jgi:hypothetical protein
MPDYRIYWLDQDNRITRADSLTVDTDEEVLAGAEALLGAAPAREVWRGAQRIGHVFAKQLRNSKPRN